MSDRVEEEDVWLKIRRSRERKKERKLPRHRYRESRDKERNINLATEKEIK